MQLKTTVLKNKVIRSKSKGQRSFLKKFMYLPPNLMFTTFYEISLRKKHVDQNIQGICVIFFFFKKAVSLSREDS